LKLGEALTLRSQLLARIAQMRERLKASALVQEGESPPEDPTALLAEFESMAGELESLIARINRTNLATQLPSGGTLTDALARRDILALRQRSFARWLTRRASANSGMAWRRFVFSPRSTSASCGGGRTNWLASGASSIPRFKRRTGQLS
jgi:hypothetical protein